MRHVIITEPSPFEQTTSADEGHEDDVKTS